ncbi:hypothetical protein [Crossiella sp. CA198]
MLRLLLALLVTVAAIAGTYLVLGVASAVVVALVAGYLICSAISALRR